MEKRNEKPLRVAIIEAGSFEYFNKVKDNSGKEHTFFTLNGVSGYVSPRAQEVLNTKGKEGVDQLRYAECKVEGSDDWIPTIMVQGGLTATMSLSATDL